jgi:flagellar hook-basal body complex protein FliE
MSQMDIDRVLTQIRSIRSQASGGLATPLTGAISSPIGAAVGRTEQPSSVSFASVLKNGIDRVNSVQQQARATATAFERGVPGVDLPQVMIDMQKSSVAFRGAVEVRNRMISAYQEIMNMPV